MKRRQFLAGVAATSAVAVAGCATRIGGKEPTETEGHRRWPTETNDPSPENTTRSWEGGADSVQPGGSKLVLDGIAVSPLFAETTQQVGVSTEQTDRSNIEDIPESEFDWYEAPDRSYFWLMYVELLFPHNEYDPDAVPEAELWRLQPQLVDDETPSASFASTFSPDPMHYRILSESYEFTSYAYPNERAGSSSTRVLAFEVPSESVELLFGDPVKAAWSFRES